MNIAGMIDHTLLKAEATPYDIVELCQEALKYEFASVCVNPANVPEALQHLGSKIKVCTVVGFPLGANDVETKIFEAKKALDQGAREIDMVINIGILKYSWPHILREIKMVREAVTRPNILKVIIESAALTDKEIRNAAIACVNSGADYVKTSTGMHTKGGARIEHVELIKRVIGDKALIKASGGIKTLADVRKFIAAGASRIGTSSGVSILKELDSEPAH